jgi:ERCC4-type nuclease
MLHLLAPTEHDLHAIFAKLSIPYKVSSMPESHGCDAVSITAKGLIGYQRKTLPDLQASLLDGRLYKELGQLQASASISHSFLVIESTLARTIDGELLGSTISIDSLRSIIAKFSASGVGYLPTTDTGDTARCILRTSTYLASDSVESVRRPKNLQNEWGTVNSESYALFLLQSFPAIGPKNARNIYSHFGCVPLQWTVTVEELTKVKGIGRKMAQSLIDALSPTLD